MQQFIDSGWDKKITMVSHKVYLIQSDFCLCVPLHLSLYISKFCYWRMDYITAMHYTCDVIDKDKIQMGSIIATTFLKEHNTNFG